MRLIFPFWKFLVSQLISVSFGEYLKHMIRVDYFIQNLKSNFKIQKEIVRWEKLFPKLEEWAHELEQFSLENSKVFDEEAPP